MKALAACVNGDGRPIQPPSLVLCGECLDGIGAKFEAMLTRLELKAQDRAGKEGA